MDRDVIRMLQEQIGELQKQVKTLQNAPALRNASIEDTSIPVIDGDGRITSVIGRQEDGSSGVSVRRSPFQPMPTVPILEAGEQAGTCAVEWDGKTQFGDAVPTIFGKIEVWAHLLGAGEEPFTAPNPGAVRVGTIWDRSGGEVLVPLPKVGTWAVWLRMVGADRDTAGLWSPASTVEIAGHFDEADFDTRIRAFADGELLEDAAYNNLMARLGEFLHIRAGSLASNDIESMRIVSSLIEATVYQIHDAAGNISARLDGVDNYLAGRIHAGMTEDAGITMDYGEQSLNIGLDDNDEPEQTVTWDAPYMAFETDQGHESAPRITVDPTNGGLRFFPGSLPSTPRFRARLNVAGDVRANRHLAGSHRASSGLFVVEGTDHTGVSTIHGGIQSASTGVRLIGRTPDGTSSTTMYGRGSLGSFTMESGSTFFKGFLTFSFPAETGTRMPFVSVETSGGAHDSNRSFAANTARSSADGFEWMVRRTSGSDGISPFHVRYFAPWV